MTVRGPALARVAPWLAIAAILAVAAVQWQRSTAPQVPFIAWDTQVFQQIADRPLGLDLVGSSKPLIVPLVFRAAGNDLLAVARFQAALALAAWTTLAITAALVVRRGWVRVVAAGVVVAFLLAPGRLGFSAAMLPESVNDSLTALAIAGLLAVLRLGGAARLVAACATGAVVLAWLFTRDTNVVVAVIAAGAAMVVWRGWRSRAAWAVCAAIACVSGVVLWSTTLAHAPLPYQRTWRVEFTPRAAYPLLNNLKFRVLPESPGELPAEIQGIDGVYPMVVDSPERAPLQRWIFAHGQATYLHWLIRHPLDRARELVRHWRSVLSPHIEPYMPGHRVARAPSVWTVTSNPVVLIGLVVGLVSLRPRTDPLGGFALCLVVAGVVGAVASYYGDASEMPRHCYGAGQALVFGLFLAAIAWLDRVRWRRATPGA